MTLEIPLSRGLVALVDDKDYERVAAVGKWYADRNAKTYYARKNFYAGAGRYTQLKMHRFITGWEFVDHVNGDGLDNRRANLRQATARQNAMNRGMRSDNRSGFKGVYWSSARSAWVAAIWVDRKSRGLGKFADPISAALAYDAAALEYFGPFARLNFPQEDVA